MEKEMEKERNKKLLMINKYLKENILKEKDGMEMDMMIKIIFFIHYKMEKD